MRILVYTIVITLILFFLIGCKAKTVYVPVERVSIEKEIEIIRDTTVNIKLVPYYSENTTDKDSSYLENNYAFSFAYWDGLFLHHTLGIKDFDIPVKIEYIDRWHTKTDSVPYIKEVPVKGDTIYKMKWYEEVIFYIGLIFLFVVFIYLGYKSFRLFK